MTLHISNDVLGLNLALESTKGALYRFTFLQSNFLPTNHPQTQIQSDTLELTLFVRRARSLRVAFVIIFFIVALVFLFVFFLVRLLAKDDIGCDRPIRRVGLGTF